LSVTTMSVVFSNNETYHHDITQILLKVALNAINSPIYIYHNLQLFMSFLAYKQNRWTLIQRKQRCSVRPRVIDGRSSVTMGLSSYNTADMRSLIRLIHLYLHFYIFFFYIIKFGLVLKIGEILIAGRWAIINQYIQRKCIYALNISFG
jgi:hypothetical protein